MYGHCSDFRKHDKYAKKLTKDDLIRTRKKYSFSRIRTHDIMIHSTKL